MPRQSTKSRSKPRARRTPARRVARPPRRVTTVPARNGAVQAFLDRFARDLTAGHMQNIVSKWGVPGLVIEDDDVRAVTSPAEVEAFFSGAKEQYNARGITDTRADIRGLEWATDKIAIVHVRWPYLDAQGQEMGNEASSYVLRRDGTGDFRFYVAVLRGASTPT